MKSSDILKILNVSRQSLAYYAKTSLIRTTEISPNRYEYCEEDVMLLKDHQDAVEQANECDKLSKICEDANVAINNVTIADESFDRVRLLENLMFKRIVTLVIDDLSIISNTESQLLCTLLSHRGCHILTVEDGELVNVVKR